jgi:acetyltransferase
MGVGKFIHTGNECDLQVTDFLEMYGEDPQVKGILMYLETIRGGRRFLEVARRIANEKPIIVHKAGRTPGGTRAARSHTGAIGGTKEVFQGIFEQVNMVSSPTMELLLPLGHAFIEHPPMKGRGVAIVTMGGSWGVALADALEEEGLVVPELDQKIQAEMRSLGMPVRASTRNPVDIGAAGFVNLSLDGVIQMGRLILSSPHIQALILYGFGRPGLVTEDTSPGRKLFLELEKQLMRSYHALQQEMDKPVILGCCSSKWGSQAVFDLEQEGFRIHHRLDEIAKILSRMYHYWERKQQG